MWKIGILIGSILGAIFIALRYRQAQREEEEKQLLAEAIEEGFGVGEDIEDY